jgi:L-histidine Nalpha-methyltransferase
MPASPRRLTVRVLDGKSLSDSLAADVRSGLAARRKALSPRFFYDALGSKLFEAICLLDEYYVTRIEHDILRADAGAILASVPGPLRLVELGSGSAEKTEYFIAAALKRQRALDYCPIDVSEAAISKSSARLLERYEGLRIHALRATFLDGLAALDAAADGVRTLALFLGSSVGNLEEDEAVALFRRVRDAIGPGGAFLVGADRKKLKDVLERAYDDPTGVTAAFNKNLLGRINRELGGRFDLSAFRHVALYDERHGRIEMHLESVRAQRIPIDALDMTVEFAAGERIHTENSYKYDDAGLDRLAAASGFRVAQTWTDAKGLFSSTLLVPTT